MSNKRSSGKTSLMSFFIMLLIVYAGVRIGLLIALSRFAERADAMKTGTIWGLAAGIAAALLFWLWARHHVRRRETFH